MKLPYLKWFYRDVQADSKLRMCSLEARGCWYEMLWVMAASDRHGYLEHKGEPYTDPMLARLLGTDIDTLYRCKRELLAAGVPSLDGETWFNRRMVADQQRREVGSKYGKKGGGNPALKKEKKEEDIRQNPEPTPQNPLSIKGGYIGLTKEFQAKYPEYMKLVADPQYKPVEPKHWARLCHDHPHAKPADIVDKALLAADESTQGIQNPVRFLRAIFAKQEPKQSTPKRRFTRTTLT